MTQKMSRRCASFPSSTWVTFKRQNQIFSFHASKIPFYFLLTSLFQVDVFLKQQWFILKIQLPFSHICEKILHIKVQEITIQMWHSDMKLRCTAQKVHISEKRRKQNNPSSTLKQIVAEKTWFLDGKGPK